MPSSAERHPEQGPHAPNLEEGFLDSYPDRAHFLQAQRDTHGWPDADEFFEDGLSLSDHGLWQALSEVYDVREQDGGVFVWRREGASATPPPPAAPIESIEGRGTRAEQIASGIERWGAAFLAYVLLPNVDLTDAAIEAHFIDVYAGYYDSRTALVDAQIESLGWPEALAAFRREAGMWDDDLLWNYDALWEHCCDVYTMSERLGGVHAFLR